MGAHQLWFFVVMLLPKSRTTPELGETIMDDVRNTCEERGVTLGGGHTGITQGPDPDSCRSETFDARIEGWVIIPLNSESCN